jgi:flagellar protein FliL
MRNVVMYIVVGVIALAVVVGAGGLTAYLVSDQRAKAAAEAATAKAAASGGAGGEKTAPGVSPLKVTPETTVELKPFTTNLADSGRTSYINVTFQLILTSNKEKKKIEEKLPLVRDTVLRVLNGKQSMEVTGKDGANKLKSDLLTEINAALGSTVVDAVLISDIVVQF